MKSKEVTHLLLSSDVSSIRPGHFTGLKLKNCNGMVPDTGSTSCKIITQNVNIMKHINKSLTLVMDKHVYINVQGYYYDLKSKSKFNFTA